MSWKPLIIKMPISVLLLTLLANILGFLASWGFQLIYMLSTNVQGIDSIGNKISYSMSGGAFIAFFAIPFSLALMSIVCLVSSKLTKWHLALAIVVSVYFGTAFWGSIFYGVPLLSYAVVTAVSSCLMIMKKQKHLTKQSS